MRVVLLGPPGAGKGTQAVLLSERLGVPHISTGDLFRANISQHTALGRAAQKCIDAGELVPAEVTNRMVEARVGEPDAANGFVLDGYPRTVDQADALTKILSRGGVALDAVLCFAVAEDIVVDRVLGRGRADDTEAVIRNRLRVYREETEPLLEHYDGLVVTIDGIGEVDEVNARALAAIG
ncbi:adenylate kinase [Nocardia sp. NPDC058518]|uniref:adenylate kinase n=1 Tax=Nocardia sp. NPDC058518 TaxID=3346534 RepID=UPI00366A4DE0